MATKFNHSPLSWAAQGIKPPTELASAGWESGYKPPQSILIISGIMIITV